MIKRLIEIKNLGRFVSFKPIAKHWDGSFKKINIIYGENGTGKTTLTQIFKSLISEKNILKRKKTFSSNEDVSIKMLAEGGLLEYTQSKWNQKSEKLEVFDIYFIEDNVFTGAKFLPENKKNLLDLTLEKEGRLIRSQLVNQFSELDFSKRRIKNLKRKISQGKTNSKKRKLPEDKITELEKTLKSFQENLPNQRKQYEKLEKELRVFLKKSSKTYVEEVNSFLDRIAPHIKINDFNQSIKSGKCKISYSISINGNSVGFTENQKEKRSIKSSLSEGDRGAIGFSFFLANLNRKKESFKDLIIVFDDPISSFDAFRKNTTVAILRELLVEIKQLFILSHDLGFIQLLTESFSKKEQATLKILSGGDSSKIVTFLANETFRPRVHKDIISLKNYLENGSDSEYEKIRIARSLRPILEEVFRYKYFFYIKETEWLGDILNKIRNANQSSPFFRLKEHYNIMSELNNFSKKFHHSDSSINPNINDFELRKYSKNCLELFLKI